MHRVLFVCMGNICRSPAGDGYLHHLVRERGIDDQFEIDSCGTIGYHAGDKADKRMRQTAKTRGYELKSIARQFERADFERFDHIIAMDGDNLSNLHRWPGCEGHEQKLSLLCDHIPGQEGGDVPDPYYGGIDGFEHCLDLIERGCECLLREILSE